MGLKAVANPAAGGQPGSFTTLTVTGNASIGGELTVDDITPTDSLTIVGGSSNPSLDVENGFGGFSARFQGVVYAINGITVNGLISSWADNGNLRISFDAGGDVSLTTGFHAATPALAAQTATSTYAGSGAPNNADGADGDFYFRSDGGVLTTIYHKRTGTWTGVV